MAKITREECAEELFQAWTDLKEVHESLRVVEEQFKRGHNGVIADASFTMAEAIKKLDEKWVDGQKTIRRMRTTLRKRLQAKAADL